MFIKISESLIKKYRATDKDGIGLVVFEYMNGERVRIECESLDKAKDLILNIQGRLDRKFFDLYGTK